MLQRKEILSLKKKNDHVSITMLLFQAWYMTAVLLKLCAQILICLKLEAPHWSLPAKVVLAPFWLLLPTLAIDVFIHLIHQSRY